MSTPSERLKLVYRLEEKTKWELSNTHLWFSIFMRPIGSAFTRLDRLTCGFVILSMNMVMNIVYYDVDTATTAATASSNATHELNIGPYIKLNVQQMSVGLISSIIVILPSLALIQIFQRTKRRNTRISQLKRILAQFSVIGHIQGSRGFEKVFEFIKKQIKSSPSPRLQFPWWFKYVAYGMACVMATVSLLFVIIKGIDLGEEKSTKWLGSILISLLSSIFIVQPLQVSH